MNIEALRIADQVSEDERLNKCLSKLEQLLEILRLQEAPQEVEAQINDRIRLLNNFQGSDKALRKELRRTTQYLLKLVGKELKLVPKNHYRNLWMALGMSSFGIPLGLAFSIAVDNFAFLAIGLPIGMSIGLALGISMDEKARKEGRQLDIDYEL